MKVYTYPGPTHPQSNGGWCREGMAVQEKPDGPLVDTFWGLHGSESKVLTAEQAASATFVFDTDDYDNLYNSSTGPEVAKWETYAEEDRGLITHQAGRVWRVYVKKGAQPSLTTQIGNTRRELDQAYSDLRAAGHRIESLGWRLGELYLQERQQRESRA